METTLARLTSGSELSRGSFRAPSELKKGTQTIAVWESVCGNELAASCYRLRHSYYVTQRRWVVEDPATPGLEVDGYDPYSIHLAVFEDDFPITYLRVLPHQPDVGFMMDREFSALLPIDASAVPREGAVELSRLVCGTTVRRAGESHPVEFLLKELYALSLERGFTRFYIVVEEHWLRPFERRFGLPFRPLGPPVTFPDGTRTVAAVAELADLETAVRRRDPAKYEWYRSGIECPTEGGK